FTVLTARLLRMEYSPSGQFEDHPSQVFWRRRLPVPEFTASRGEGGLTIQTPYLLLAYTGDSVGAVREPPLQQPPVQQQPMQGPPHGFNHRTLSIEVSATGHTWHFGDRDYENLRGTARTLDGAGGAVHLDPGLVSRQGWAVVDDSNSLVFNADCWIEPRAHPENTDLYFLGHGHDYLGALGDFTQVAGAIPLIPRWALGNWWSRYWAYTQAEYLYLVDEFRQHDVPLGVSVIDMDWHMTRTGNQSSGWTGYTWNRDLFPYPDEFLRDLHAAGLKTSLNIHPAEGVHPHEERYPEMALRLGIDPASQDPVPFDIADPRFAAAYFEVLHHPEEQRGIDFWWIDWQQGGRTTMPGLDPLYWLNHLHYLDLARDGLRRPFIFSRWPGLGGHRYPIGFSGDTRVTWASLAFQPYFTATASNVAYTWWSHDIGGHMDGGRDPELYARWVQYGVFSPILRLHSTSNRFLERRPWGYDAEIERISSSAMRLRASLLPYLYSMAWRAAAHSSPLVQPMYYLYPESDAAYRCPDQYFFGSELLAAPFVTPRDPDTCLSAQTVWLPAGDWFNFFNGEHHSGGRWLTFYGGLDEIPVLARAGAIVPMQSPTGSQDLVIHVFPGANNAFELYEDDGETQAYRQGQSCITRFSQKWGGEELVFTIDPAEGEPSVLPPDRRYELVFHGLRQPDTVTVFLNGAEVGAHRQPGAALRLDEITLSPADCLKVQLSVREGTLLSHRDHRAGQVEKLLLAFNLSAN
ncbi:MAG TPA: TIM-barrel domain-containing protein, partial [Polyangia bacterium]